MHDCIKDAAYGARMHMKPLRFVRHHLVTTGPKDVQEESVDCLDNLFDRIR